MNVWEISVEDKNRLHQKRDALVKICEELSAYDFPAVLNHSDFQDNNMLIDHDSGRITIIDWGETNIGNPLLSLSSCLYFASKLYELKPDREDYKSLRTNFFGEWGIPEQEFERILCLIDTLDQIYYVLTFQDLMNRTGHDFPKWSSRIRKALAVFIEKTNNFPNSLFRAIKPV